MSEKSRRTLAGWQGITVEVPADWSLAAINGDEKSGYFRVDSTGTLTVEAKWSKASGQVDLSGKLESYLNDLRKKSRRRRVEFEHKIKPKDAGVLAFSWRADRKAQGRLWRCDECGRILIAQVSGAPGDDVAGIASYVLPSITDHSEDGWRTWAMYDLIAEVPPEYRLEKHRLMAGYLQLVFRKGNNGLVIERWGLANVALRKCTLAEWFGERTAHDLRPYRYSIEELPSEPEPAVQAVGRRAGVRQALKSAWEFVTLRKPAVHLDCYAWLCEESNKIFSVQTTHSSKEQILDEVLERVECH